jgi:hypothetical protein
MQTIAHTNLPNGFRAAHWIALAYAFLVVGASAVALALLAVGHHAGLLGVALAIGAVPAVIAAIGLVFHAAFLVIGFVQTAADPQLAAALRRESSMAAAK